MAAPNPKEAIDELAIDSKAIGEAAINEAAQRALAEDLGAGDVTTNAVIPAGARARASIVARERCVVAGIPIARRVFELLDPDVTFRPGPADGDRLESGKVVLAFEGKARAILSGERVALNYLQALSGIATTTRDFIERAASSSSGPSGVEPAAKGRVAILHTRKTTPGLRSLERYAVGIGGGAMHRAGLFDEVLIKENHFALSGLSVEATVRKAREKVGNGVVVGAEARNHEEARAAIAGGANYVLLDNFSPKELREEAARLRALLASNPASNPKATKVEIEASGGIRIDNVADFAAAGVDRISVGALTHSARAIDLALDVEALDGEALA
jgi:nicotinate-nucleotide pyrophosphorylase (carboxylating)